MLGVAAPTLSFLGEAALPSAPSVASVAGHLVVDLVALGVLVTLAHLRNRARGGLGFALVVLNVGLFATLVAITGEAFTAGAGFGLFGVLSLIRLRSASFTTPDMAYTFLAVVLGLVCGLVALPLWLTVGAAGLLAVLPAFADRGEPVADGADAGPETEPAMPTRRIDVVLDGAFGTAGAARAEVERRLGVVALEVALDEVDYVREVTKVRVTVPAPEAAPAPAARPVSPAAGPGVVTGPWAGGQRLPHQLPAPSHVSQSHVSQPSDPGLAAALGLTGGMPLSPDVATHPAPPATGDWSTGDWSTEGWSTGDWSTEGWSTDGADTSRRARRLRSAGDPGDSGRLPRLLGPAGSR
jgi:hypothetical protein